MIQEAQREDQQLLQLMEYLECQTLPEDPAVASQVTSHAQRGYYILDGVLYYEDPIMPGRRRVVVPRSKCCWRIMKQFLQAILHQRS